MSYAGSNPVGTIGCSPRGPRRGGRQVAFGGDGEPVMVPIGLLMDTSYGADAQ